MKDWLKKVAKKICKFILRMVGFIFILWLVGICLPNILVRFGEPIFKSIFIIMFIMWVILAVYLRIKKGRFIESVDHVRIRTSSGVCNGTVTKYSSHADMLGFIALMLVILVSGTHIRYNKQDIINNQLEEVNELCKKVENSSCMDDYYELLNLSKDIPSRDSSDFQEKYDEFIKFADDIKNKNK